MIKSPLHRCQADNGTIRHRTLAISARARAYLSLGATLALGAVTTPAIAQTAEAASAAAASAAEPADLQLALLRYAGGQWNPRPHGLPRLAWELRRRTSVAVNLEVATADATSDELFQYPFLVWEGDGGFAALPEVAIANLRHHIQRGGTLVIDLSDATPGGAFDQAVRRELARILPDGEIVRVPTDHVVYKSFYLVDRHGGRVPARAFLEGMFVAGRLAVVISANDLAGAMARDEFGTWEYDVGAGGDAVRESSFRLGINLIMYALCLDYKDDQVHIPFILQRRR